MTDLISRSDAIEAVRKELVCDGRHETHDKTCRFIADVLLSALPSAEVAQGEWIFNTDENNGKSWNICSVCGYSIFHTTKFCPNCGARMIREDCGK